MEANRFRSRAWSTKYNLFLAEVEIYSDGSFTADYRREDGALVSQNMDECIVEQSTGLGDANGVEIFEGDVVYVAGIGNMVVEYDQSVAGMRFKDDDQDLDYQEVIEDLERVIGNIHQNPELLEAS